MVVAGVRGQGANLVTTTKAQFTGKNNFAYWLVSILVIGAIGYAKPLQPLSRAFLVLVIVVLFLTSGNGNAGFFAQFQKQAFGPDNPNAGNSTTSTGTSSTPASTPVSSVPFISEDGVSETAANEE